MITTSQITNICFPHTPAPLGGGVSEENDMTCKIEDISPLGFTYNSMRFKPSIGLQFVNEVFRNNKKGALTIVKRWI